MKRTYTLLFLFLFVNFSCSEEQDLNTLEQNNATISAVGENSSISGKTFSYLALGDSYTIGQGVETDDNWPNQLKQQLLSKTITIDPLKIIAKTGWTTNTLLRAIDSEDPGQYDMVSLMIGVNNQFQNIPFSEFEEEFEVLLNKAIILAGGEEKVFVVSIPDYSVTKYSSSNPSKIAQEIDTYNRYIEQRCILKKIQFIDVTTISRSLGDADNALAEDGLHPSTSQYTKWVTFMLSDITNLLEK